MGGRPGGDVVTRVRGNTDRDAYRRHRDRLQREFDCQRRVLALKLTEQG